LKNIRIKDGETLVIGGMIKETEQKTVNKMPLLGDLPGVGMFFRNTGNEKSKQELVIMITPKIIKDSEDVVNTNNNSGATL
jgi:type II secretory pathway component GspD/PulD (secretin)